MYLKLKHKKKKLLTKAQNKKNANVAGSVLLSLFMDMESAYRPRTPTTGLSRIQHLNMVIVNFEF